MFDHGPKEPDMLDGVLVLSLEISQCGPFGGDRHQKTHKISF